MKVTPEQAQQQQSDYEDAYGQDAQRAPEPSEDQAFGIDPAEHAEPAAEEATETPPQEAAEAPAEAPPEIGAETPFEAAGDSPDAADGAPRTEGEDQPTDAVPAEPAEEPTDGPVDLAKERQRLKSWEGRLKKIEAELAAKAPTVEPAAAEAIETVSETAEKQGDEALGDAAAKASEQVESGELTPAQAMKQLAEDFGEDFVKMIEAIAGAKAREVGESSASAKVGEIGQAVNDIISHITDRDAKAHFKQIAAAHPDFNDIGRSEGFAQFVDSQPDPADAKRVVTSGSADEIVALLDAYKKSQQGDSPAEAEAADEPAAKPVVDEATNASLDAAEGVRSTGMKLPTQPAPSSSSYEDAWREMS